MQIDNKTCVIWRPVKFYGTQPGYIILKNTQTLSWRLERSLYCHNQSLGHPNTTLGGDDLMKDVLPSTEVAY